MKKKMMSLALAVVMCLSLCVPAFAAPLQSDSAFSDQENNDEFIAENYNQYTIDIGEENLRGENSASLLAESDVDKTYEQAVTFVNSLDLSNYPEIKVENLDYLKSLHESGAIIESYTVLTPKRSDQFYTYGTYHGFTYYYQNFSTASYTIFRNENWSSQSLTLFVSGVNNLVSLIPNYGWLSYPWTTFSMLSGIPSRYIVKPDDTAETYLRVTAQPRAIYVKDALNLNGYGNDFIVRVYTGENGTARPYMRYITGSTSASVPEYSAWLDDNKLVYTPDFNDKTATMAKAEGLYHQRLSPHEYLSNYIQENGNLYLG